MSITGGMPGDPRNPRRRALADDPLDGLEGEVIDPLDVPDAPPPVASADAEQGGLPAIPSGHRPTGDRQRVIEVPEVDIVARRGDALGSEQPLTARESATERERGTGGVTEYRGVEPIPPARGEVRHPGALEIAGRAAEEAAYAAWPLAGAVRNIVRYQALDDAPRERARELNRPSIGGRELPSAQSAPRALEAAQRMEPPSGVLEQLMPPAERPAGMSDSEPDLRSQAGYRHALSGFGWADELAPMAGQPLAALRGEGWHERPAAAAEMRALQRMSAEQAPGSAMAGQMAETIPLLAVPGGQRTAGQRIAAAGLTGFTAGGVRGAGESEAEAPVDIATDAVNAGLAEGGLNAVMQGAGEVAGPALSRLARLARTRAPAIERGAVQSRLEASGVWGGGPMGAADRLPGGAPALAQDARRLGIGHGVGDPGRMAEAQATGEAVERSWIPRSERALDDAAQVRREAGQRLEAVHEQMDEAASRGVQAREPGAGGAAPGHIDVMSVADRMDALASQAERIPVGGPQIARSIRTRIVAPLRANPVMTFRDAQAQREMFREMIGEWEATPRLSRAAGQLQTAYDEISRAMADAAEAVDPQLRAAWRAANRDYQVGAFIRQHGRGATRLSVGGGMGGANAAGEAIANSLPGGALGAFAGREVAQQQRMLTPGFRAVRLETFARGLRAAGPALERAAARMANAARRGPGTLAAQHFILMQSDPEYRRAYERAQEQE